MVLFGDVSVNQAIATLITALPAAALPTYTSSPPTFSSDAIKVLDITPVLVTSNDSISVYRSAGFLSHVATDGNLYVERIFYTNQMALGQVVTTVALKQIDCGRMLNRSLKDAVIANGATTFTGITAWSQFVSLSIAANTCEAAASDRGIDWTWTAR